MDIVERLRALYGTNPVIMEAADYIEALREALKEVERISASQMNGSLYPDDASG